MNAQSQSPSDTPSGSESESTAESTPDIENLETTFQEGRRKKKKRNVPLIDDGLREMGDALPSTSTSISISSELEDGTDTAEDEDEDEEFERVTDQVWGPIQPEYRMNFAERGKALIFNHEDFMDETLKRRAGTSIDKKELEATLKILGFEVTVHDDLSRRQLLSSLNTLSKDDHSDRDCMVIAVLSHGTKDEIHAQDETYKREELWDPFTADNCPSLAMKPKIFIIQACRGTRFDQGTMVNENTHTDTGYSCQGAETFQIPNQSDFIFLHSSFQGYISFRRQRHPSPFIATLCRVLKEESETTDLLSMSTTVNLRMTMDFKCTSKNERYKDRKQCPAVESSLTRKIYFRAKTGGWPYAGRMENIRQRPRQNL